MLHYTTVCRKNPVIFKQGQGMFTHQLKRILRKKSVHRFNWDPLLMYEPRKLVHSNRQVDHDTYQEKYNPHWEQNSYLIPDQKYLKIPVPEEFKDAYWWRDLQARRVQCPVEWVAYKMYTKDGRNQTDFQDLAFRKKHMFSMEETIENAKRERS